MSQLLARRFVPSDEEYRAEETVIRSVDELLAFLEQRGADDPTFFDLIAPTGVTATVGAGGPVWALMFLPADGEPPYLWLTSQGESVRSEEIEFDACGTPTPVPSERLVAPAEVKTALLGFLRTGDRPEGFVWDED